MKTFFVQIMFFVCAVWTAGFCNLQAETLNEGQLTEKKQNVHDNLLNIFDKQYIKNIMDKVNQYQLAHPHQKFDDNWIRGTYYTGVMACYQATGDKK
ncbi:MAG: hypothetical protein LBC74_00205, partial [Planctomycetaceae bacterium]|nr:hypothetical protein [Planctomycetaceae bacterium]